MAGQSDVDAAADIAFGDDEEEAAGDVYEKDELLSLIARELNAGGDAEGEEEVEGIRIHPGGKLMALTTLQNHIKLAKILERFRKATGMMVTVESRFLDIQDNFLESIGINIGNPQANFLPNTIPDIDGNGTALNPGYEFTDAGGEMNLRVASIGALSNPLGSQVNPFNLSGTGGGSYQVNAINPDRFVLEALLTGVAKDQEIRRLNSPRVTAFNTQTAHTLVVNQAAYIQDLEVNQTGVIPVINPVIGVLNTGSILEVRPTISFDRKYVVLEIQPTLAEQIGESQALLNLSGGFTTVPVQLPVVSVTKIKTTVNVPDGGTVLLGGLKREVKQKASIGLPALRRIPLANLFFGRNANAALRSNLFVLINVHITVVHEEEARLFGTGI
jgi:general secretion pathway protein D